jgi:hypothetical protein
LLVSFLAYGGVADFFSTLETSFSSLLLIRVVTGLYGTSGFFYILILLLLGLVLLLLSLILFHFLHFPLILDLQLFRGLRRLLIRAEVALFGWFIFRLRVIGRS